MLKFVNGVDNTEKTATFVKSTNNTHTMNATTELIQVKGYKVLGASDEGQCDRCGKQGLKRTVAIQAVDADGLGFSDSVEHWGVCCAAYAKYGSKGSKAMARIEAEATRADNDRAYEIETKGKRIAADLTYSYKVMFPVSHTETLTFDCLKSAANRKYAMTGRSLVGSYFASNDQGHIVRVDGKDAADVSFYTERGFVQVTAPVA
jgi:hypothetical protein